MEYACNNITSKILTESTSEFFNEPKNIELPKRMNNTNFEKYSKVKSTVECPKTVFETPIPINETVPKEYVKFLTVHES